MKKILFAVMAMIAIGLTSCTNKAQQDEATAAAEASISALTEQLQAGDASKFAEVLTTVKEKIAEFVKSNPEVAKEYVAKVQEFLKENADKVKALVGDNATIAAAVSAITNIEPDNVVNGLLETVGDAAEAAKDSIAGAVEDAKDAAVDAAKDKANEAIDDAASKAKDALGI